MQRYSVLPITLYRCQLGLKPKFRQMSVQIAKGKLVYDFELGPNKLYNPMEGDIFLRPNGLTLQPVGINLANFLATSKGKYVFQLPKGLAIPDSLVLIHEHTDHYSLQTTKPIEPSKFCLEVQEVLAKLKQIPREELLAQIMKTYKSS